MFDKFQKKVFDMCPNYLYWFYYNYLRPSRWIYKCIKFKNDIKWGFNTDESWDIDDSFYNWLSPRLKYFRQVNNGYPDGKTWESWCKELDENIHKLDIILEYNYDSWSCSDEFLTEEDRKELVEKYKDEITPSILNDKSYDNCKKSFNKWFGENINHLWW